MSLKRREVKLDETLGGMVAAYMQATGIKSEAAAILELAIKGFEAWGQFPDEATLRKEHSAWKNALLAKGYDPASDQDRGYSFARFLVERMSKWGGNRNATSE